jgi:aspartate 1-decarboxylase
MLPYEQVHVLTSTHGARFETYLIEGAPAAAWSAERCRRRLGAPATWFVLTYGR